MTRFTGLDQLRPAFRRAVATLLKRMEAAGYHPRVHETYRTPERSGALVAAGKSRAKGPSMHCYRIAVDVICDEHRWDCEKLGCGFYTRLGAEYEKLGITWGGNWDGDGVTREQREHDLPHGQGVPAGPAIQDRVRAATPEQIDAMLAEYLRA